MAFKNVFESIADKVQDLSELTVTTIEGSLTLTGSDATVGGANDIDDLLAAINAKLTTDATVMASTRVRLDGDTIAYYDAGITDAKREAHADLVRDAAETRQATIDMFGKIADILK